MRPFLLSLLSVVLTGSTARAAIVANFGADFQTGTPKAGWSYLWNANGAIGAAANYVPLAPDSTGGGDYESAGGGVWPDPAPGAFTRVTATHVYPGQTAAQDAGGLQRFTILAYTFTADQINTFGNGLRFHTYDFDIPDDVPGLIDVRIFRNDTPVPPPFTFGAPGFSDADFGQDFNFGTVSPLDTLYIAFGTRGEYAGQPLGVAYTLALVPEPASLGLILLPVAAALRRRRTR